LNKKIPFVAVTAGTDEATIRQLKHSGFTAVLTKPYTEYILYQQLINSLNIDKWREGKPGNIGAGEVAGINHYHLDELMAMADGDRKFLINMLQLFIKTTEEAIGDLSTEVSKQNGPEIAAIAHRSIPPCRHLKLQWMVDQFSALEQAGKHNDVTKADDILKLIRISWPPLKEAIEGEIVKSP
jgi:hypothetical protein